MSEATFYNWEGNATTPLACYLPRIIAFLGYDPIRRTDSFAQRLVAARRSLGLSQREMAKRLGVDPSTITGWESGRHAPTERGPRENTNGGTGLRRNGRNYAPFSGRILKDMSLILGIKCDEGYVVCADSQETVPLPDGTEERVTCQKLVPILIGAVAVSIAGAGDADLIDAFVERLRVSYAGSEIASLEACRTVIQDELAAFKIEKRLRRTGGRDPFTFLIGAQSPAQLQCVLWRTAAGELIAVQKYALVGYEDTRYDYEARNLYKVGMPLSQGSS